MASPLAGRDAGTQRLARAQPGREQQPGLGPGEDPRNRAQRLHPARRGAACRPAADGQRAELDFGRGGAEVGHELRLLVDDVAVGGFGGARERVHQTAPVGRRRLAGCRAWLRASPWCRARGSATAMSGKPNCAWIISPCSVTRSRPVDRARRLRLDREVGRSAAAADAAAAAVEQRQLHAGNRGPSSTSCSCAVYSAQFAASRPPSLAESE